MLRTQSLTRLSDAGFLVSQKNLLSRLSLLFCFSGARGYVTRGTLREYTGGCVVEKFFTVAAASAALAHGRQDLDSRCTFSACPPASATVSGFLGCFPPELERLDPVIQGSPPKFHFVFDPERAVVRTTGHTGLLCGGMHVVRKRTKHPTPRITQSSPSPRAEERWRCRTLLRAGFCLRRTVELRVGFWTLFSWTFFIIPLVFSDESRKTTQHSQVCARTGRRVLARDPAGERLPGTHARAHAGATAASAAFADNENWKASSATPSRSLGSEGPKRYDVNRTVASSGKPDMPRRFGNIPRVVTRSGTLGQGSERVAGQGSPDAHARTNFHRSRGAIWWPPEDCFLMGIFHASSRFIINIIISNHYHPRFVGRISDIGTTTHHPRL